MGLGCTSLDRLLEVAGECVGRHGAFLRLGAFTRGDNPLVKALFV